MIQSAIRIHGVSRIPTFGTFAPVSSGRGCYFLIHPVNLLVALLSITASRHHFILLLTLRKVLHSTIHYNSAHATFKTERGNYQKS